MTQVFEWSRDEKHSMATLQKLVVFNQTIQLDNQEMMVQCMKYEDLQDCIAVQNAEAYIFLEQIGFTTY